MRDLSFNVTKLLLEKDPECDFDHLFAGTKGYLNLKFTFDETWDGLDVVIQIVTRDRTEYYKLTDGAFALPDWAAAMPYFKVRLTGVNQSVGLSIGTNSVYIHQEV